MPQGLLITRTYPTADFPKQAIVWWCFAFLTALGRSATLDGATCVLPREERVLKQPTTLINGVEIAPLTPDDSGISCARRIYPICGGLGLGAYLFAFVLWLRTPHAEEVGQPV